MEKITLERRLTHKYNAGYSYLDESEFVGTARIMCRKLRREDNESKSSFSILLVSSKESAENVISGIYDTFRSACRCEHDCCGHWQSSVDKIRPLKGNMYAVIESAYRNI